MREWLWQSSRLAELRQKARWETENVQLLDRRARLSAEVAARTLEPSEPFVSGSAHAVACDLYRQSIHWSLLAIDARRSGHNWGAEGSTPMAEALAALARHLDEAPNGLKEDDGALETARGHFSKTFVDFAELPAPEQVRVAFALRRVADSLLTQSGTTRGAIDSVWLRRALTVTSVLGLVAAVLIGTAVIGSWREIQSDLARGRPWRVSSTYGAAGCKSPQQTCPDGPDYFFHTAEEDRPWVEFDLGSVQTIGAVRVENRRDCCTERAAPLSVEISTDQKQWREVLHKEDNFRSWKGEFTKVRARYVRLRATRRVSFHLAGVRILPG
jgi:hypothetical protein